MKQLPMIEMEVYSALCALKVFRVNGIEADYDDFGDKYDQSPETAEDYACGDMTFTPKMPTQEVLDKYKITLEQYTEIADELASKLSFGACGWCV